MADNPDVLLTLKEGVQEVLNILTGLDLEYDPTLDRFRSITSCINRSLRTNALDHEWSYYSSLENIGLAVSGTRNAYLRGSVRPRLIGGDSIQLKADDRTVLWAYSMVRDENAKYEWRDGLWYTVVGSEIQFSRPFNLAEDGLDIWVPVMREPRRINLTIIPPAEDDPEGVATIDPLELEQKIDFDYPDIIIMRAAWEYAQSDPLYQPRVQTLEQRVKNMMYNLVERDDSHTDAPFLNEWSLPIQSSVNGGSSPTVIGTHPHADERDWRGRY